MLRKLIRAVPLALLLLALAAMPAQAQQVTASAVNVEVTPNGDGVDAKFNIAVTNAAGAAALNVWVVFADGQEVVVGDVAAEATGTSAAVSRTLAEVVTANQPVPVTLKYSQDGAAVEVAATLIVRVK